MKCLIINGSCHKGNTWRLTELVKEDLLALDATLEFDEIHLKDIDLPYCLGCSLCFRQGHTRCPHNNVVQGIIDKIDECDGLIFAAPTFNMHIPAVAKNLIDHLSFMLHRPRYFDKKALIISTTGAVGAKDATKYVCGTLIGLGFNRCFQLPISAISYNDYQPSEKHIRKCADMAKKFYNALKSEKLHSPSFSAVMTYNLFRGISRHYTPGYQYATYDGTYWDETGLVKTAYSPQVPLPFYKMFYGNLFYWIGKNISKRLVVTYK